MRFVDHDDTPAKAMRRHTSKIFPEELKESRKNRVLKQKSVNAWDLVFEDDSDDSLLQELVYNFDDSSFDGDLDKSMFYYLRSNRLMAGKIIGNGMFQAGMVFLLTLNSILIGMSTLDFIQNDTKWSRVLETVDSLFLSIFTAEVILKIIYMQIKFFTKPETTLDLLVVALSWAYSSTRIFRTFLLIGRVRSFRFVVKAVVSIYSEMLSIATLMMILIYIFAVMTTTLYRDAFDRGITSENYFGRLDLSCFTLFQILSLDNWVDITRELMAEYKSAWLVMIGYAFLSGIILFNLFLAVCNKALDELRKSQVSIQIQKKTYQDIGHLSLHDTDLYISGKITFLEEQLSDLLKLHKKTQQALGTLHNHLTDLASPTLQSGFTSRHVKKKFPDFANFPQSKKEFMLSPPHQKGFSDDFFYSSPLPDDFASTPNKPLFVAFPGMPQSMKEVIETPQQQKGLFDVFCFR